MHSHFVTLFGVEITMYGLMIAVAFAVLWFNIVRRGRLIGYPEDFLQNLLTLIVVGAMIGSRTLLVVANFDYYAQYPSEIIFSREAGVFLGGFLFASVIALYYTRKHKRSMVGVMDLFATYLPLSHAIGRIGCFLFGCCYGSVCHLPCAVRFPKDSPAYIDHYNHGLLTPGADSSLPVHPTQLYESTMNLGIFLFLLTVRKGQRFRGQIAMNYLILYGAGRFLIEFVRGDESRGTWGWFSTSQWMCILMIGGGIFGYLKLRQRAIPPETPVQTTPPEINA